MDPEIIFQDGQGINESNYEPPSKRTKLEISDKNESKTKPFSKIKRKGLPSPIINYIIKEANAKVLKKMHRSSKYFFKKAPYLFIDNCNDYSGFYLGNETIKVEEFKGKNCWVTRTLYTDVMPEILFMQKIVRCNAISINCEISLDEFKLLTKLECLKSLSYLQVIYENGKLLPFETILSYLTHLERIHILARLITPQTFIKLESLPFKNKIGKFYLTDIDKVFDVKLFIQFLQKALAPKAEVLLHFNALENDEEGRENYSDEMEEEIEASWMPIYDKPYFLVISEDQMYNMCSIEDTEIFIC